jgi:Plant pleckstrin homology-like region
MSGLIIDVCTEIAAWPGRELEEGLNQRAYFGIKTPERRIEFECRNLHDKKLWIQGIKEMLDRRDNINIPMVV